MLNPGIHSLGDFTIAGAGTQIGDWTSETVDLAGLLAALAQLRFTGGAGGTSVQAYLQTSVDQGTTAIDIWCAKFMTSAEVGVENFSALTPKTSQYTPTDGALADDTSIDGALGDRFRLKVVTVGTYTGSPVLSGRLCVR